MIFYLPSVAIFRKCFHLVHHIHFKLACNNTYNFAWKFHIIIIDKCPVSSRKLYFRYAFSDNFTSIIVFFRLMVSDFKNTNNSVGVLRWVPRLLIWWCYGQENPNQIITGGFEFWTCYMLTYHYGSKPTVVTAQWS